MNKIILLVLIVAILLGACAVRDKGLDEEITADASEVKIMFFTTELESEITVLVGEELELAALAYAEAQKLDNAAIVWASSNEDVLTVESMDNNTAKLKVLKKSDAPVKIEASCGEAKRELTVHIREQIK